MTELFSPEALTAFFQVVMIDLVLAGDNAIVIGLAAAGLPKEQRGKAILIGIIAATILRIGFASVTVMSWKTRSMATAHRPGHARRSARRSGRSPSPTFRCRSTTCSLLPAPRASTRRS